MGLNICKLAAEYLLKTFDCQIFNNINALAAAVIAVGGIALGVFVGKHAAHCGKHRGADNVFRRDKLNVCALPFKLCTHSVGNFLVLPCNQLHLLVNYHGNRPPFYLFKLWCTLDFIIPDSQILGNWLKDRIL